MRSKTKGAWWLAGAAGAIGFIVWPGCTTPPLPSSREPISWHQPSDFSFTQDAHPSRADIVDKFGQPDSYFSDVRVASYKLNLLRRRRLWLLLGILPIAAPRDTDRVEVALIQFDDQDRVRRSEIVKFPADSISAAPSRYEVNYWLKNPPAKKH